MGMFQALILSQFAREDLTQPPLFSAWETKQTQALPPGKVEGDVLLPVWSWEMLTLLRFSHSEARSLVTSLLPALLLLLWSFFREESMVKNYRS